MDKLAAKRLRKSAPKTRSGCSTCKKCQGYPTPPAQNSRGVQNPAQNFSSIASYSIPFKVPGSQADRQLLHYYCCQAAWNLSSYADPTLWTELILQRSQDQPVIRNGLVVLSSLHKDFVCGSFTNKPSLHVETMTMVSKCYVQLKNYLARSDAQPDVALVCSVIFYSLESLLGDTQQAISHLDSGLKLLKRTQHEGKWADEQLIVQLTHLLERLDIQASSYDDLRLPVLELVGPEDTRGVLSVVPDSFQSLDHAEGVLVKLQNWTLRQLISQVQHKGKPSSEIPQGLWRERVVLRQQYERYRHSLSGLGNNIGNSASNVSASATKDGRQQLQHQQFLLLQISFHTFYSLIEENVPIAADAMSYPPDDEDTLGTALSEVLGLLSLATRSASRSASALFPLASPSQRTYTLSTFLIGTLYFVCLKTTHPEILATACRLFSHPLLKHSRDGLWDSRLAEMVVKNVMKIRDRGMGMDIPDNIAAENPTTSTFTSEDVSLEERTDYLTTDLSMLTPNESDLFTDAAAFLITNDSFLLPTDAVAPGTSLSVSGANSSCPSEDSFSIFNTSDTSLPYANTQRIEDLTRNLGRVSYIDSTPESYPRTEQDQIYAVEDEPTAPSVHHYVQIRPKTLPRVQLQSKDAMYHHQFTVPRGKSPGSSRLEDFALGIVDADGGIEEAAKRVSAMFI
ncbi:hypothetical protein AYO21_01137 [Fonsecaea monophora]|uniref:Transcription factor domain-containing protein n=1 Tax=Fonsecaea monophora TaxID=254056 RepID=A0A177FKC9_9EURO|nr:hypothetical protein AYO21_01137 [Fonsecaea monophora]OAG44647.1 hypothetical protein AYO21_01137 [Fonsecaea monophora]